MGFKGIKPPNLRQVSPATRGRVTITTESSIFVKRQRVFCGSFYIIVILIVYITVIFSICEREVISVV